MMTGHNTEHGNGRYLEERLRVMSDGISAANVSLATVVTQLAEMRTTQAVAQAEREQLKREINDLKKEKVRSPDRWLGVAMALMVGLNIIVTVWIANV